MSQLNHQTEASAAERLRAQLLIPADACMDLPGFLIWAKISRTMAFREVKAGRLVVHRIGRKWLISPEAARAWRAALPTTRVFKEIKAGRLKVRKLGDKSIIPLENAFAWRDSLPTNATEAA